MSDIDYNTPTNRVVVPVALSKLKVACQRKLHVTKSSGATNIYGYFSGLHTKCQNQRSNIKCINGKAQRAQKTILDFPDGVRWVFQIKRYVRLCTTNQQDVRTRSDIAV